MATRTFPLGIALDVHGEEEIARSFGNMGGIVRIRVRKVIEDFAAEILVREKSAIRVRTGATREAFDSEIKETDQGITARIGWWRLGGPGGPGWKGIFQESGVHGAVVVKKFQRGSRGGYVRKTITLKSGKTRRIKAVGGTYTRRVNIAARPFVAPAWGNVKGRVAAAIEAAIAQAKTEAGFGA